MNTAKRIISALLVSFLLVQSAAAADIITHGALPAYQDNVTSTIEAGCTLGSDDAALRLYYLNMITGTGTNVSGGIDFDLDKGLTRIEEVVFAARVMGAESLIESASYSHPYADVPGWASSYVGYMYSKGLLSYIDGDYFAPNAAVSANEFMSFMLYALGFRIQAGDYTFTNAAQIGKECGIYTPEKKVNSNLSQAEAFTRGDAVSVMYNTLRSTVKNSSSMLSERLIENGVISYQDAVFLLWSDDKSETQNYMDAVGYSIGWIISDGYYNITTEDGSKSLNVSVTGANKDYEGAGVNIWDVTDDVTQLFRIERTEKGTYLIYSAASLSGYGRVLGFDGTKAGLYKSSSSKAQEYYIKGSVDGTWSIVSVSDPTKVLSCTSEAGGSAVTMQKSGSAQYQSWNFTRAGVINSEGKEIAVFPCKSLLVTQGAYDTYSHQKQNAVDVQPTDAKAYAPFNAQVVHIDGSSLCNAVWIESTEKVLYADGTYDYMTVSFLHDNDVSNLKVGTMLQQGDYFYDSGNAGNSTGKHIHICVYRGKYDSSMKIGCGDVNVEDALFLPDDIYVVDSYNIDWTYVSAAD